MKAVIAGGVAAGMSAASKIKRVDPSAQVTVYEKGGFLSYGACGLPYFIGGYNDDPDLLIARTKEEFERQGISTFLHHEVIALNAATRSVQVRNLSTGDVFEDSYDSFLIATGCNSANLPIPGADLPGVFRVRSMEEGLLLKRVLSRPDVRRAVIIGGGYIGVEMAEVLAARGLETVLLEAVDRILLPFEPEFSVLATQELERNGVRVRVQEGALSIADLGDIRRVTTARGVYDAELVLISVGVVPATGFLKDTGIRLAENGAVIVDREMRTSLPGVFSAGDCATVYNRVMEEDSFQPLGTVANKCGRIAGGNMTGLRQKFPGALGSAAVKICDLELARTGLGERDAKKLGFETSTSMISTMNHPLYYPGSRKISIKLVCEKGTRRLLGACAGGGFGCGAVLRINALALAVQARLSADDVGMADFAYAPPFSGAWDAVHIAANTVP